MNVCLERDGLERASNRGLQGRRWWLLIPRCERRLCCRERFDNCFVLLRESVQRRVRPFSVLLFAILAHVLFVVPLYRPWCTETCLTMKLQHTSKDRAFSRCLGLVPLLLSRDAQKTKGAMVFLPQADVVRDSHYVSKHPFSIHVDVLLSQRLTEEGRNIHSCLPCQVPGPMVPACNSQFIRREEKKARLNVCRWLPFIPSSLLFIPHHPSPFSRLHFRLPFCILQLTAVPIHPDPCQLAKATCMPANELSSRTTRALSNCPRYWRLFQPLRTGILPAFSLLRPDHEQATRWAVPA